MCFKKKVFKYLCLTTLIGDIIVIKTIYTKFYLTSSSFRGSSIKLKFSLLCTNEQNCCIVMQINKESIFVSLAWDILYNVAASSTEETVFYSSLAVNASINMVMSVTHHFMQSFNDLNNGKFFLAWV